MRAVPARWETALLVCGKCSRKLGGGFGPKGRTPLAKALGKIAKAGGKGRKARFGVVETGCLKVCPKRAVVLVDTRAPDRWLLVPPGRDEGALLAELGLGARAAPAEVELLPVRHAG